MITVLESVLVESLLHSTLCTCFAVLMANSMNGPHMFITGRQIAAAIFASVYLVVAMANHRPGYAWGPTGCNEFYFLDPILGKFLARQPHLWFSIALWCGWILWIGGDWRRSRLARDNKCKDCEYDLTGNVSGICPECGLTIGDRKHVT